MGEGVGGGDGGGVGGDVGTLTPTSPWPRRCVGGVFFLNALGTRVGMAETQPRREWESLGGRQDLGSPRGMLRAAGETFAQWRPVLETREIRSVVALHCAYWACLAGANMTLLPLMLTDAERFGLTPAQVGGGRGGGGPAGWRAVD